MKSERPNARCCFNKKKPIKNNSQNVLKCQNKNSLCPLDMCEKLSFVKDINVYQQEIIFIKPGITESLQHCDMSSSLRIRPWPPDFSFWPLHWNPVGVKNEPDYRGRWTRPGSSPQCWKLCFPSRQKRPGHGYWTFRSFLWKKIGNVSFAYGRYWNYFG